jgi:mannosyltransferase OCH1-like enzyme
MTFLRFGIYMALASLAVDAHYHVVSASGRMHKRNAFKSGHRDDHAKVASRKQFRQKSMSPERLVQGSALDTYPLVLHQSWKNESLPANFRLWSDECKRIHAKWNHRLWTDEDNRALVAKYVPTLLPVYDGYDVNIKRADAARYVYMYVFGGVYIDLDVLCLKKFENIFAAGLGRPVFAYEVNKGSNRQPSIANAFMMAPPRHMLFASIISALHDATDNPVFQATGPAFLTNFLHVRGWVTSDQALVLDSEVVYGNQAGWYEWHMGAHPCGAANAKDVATCAAKLPNAIATTFWTGSWKSKEWLTP